MRLKRIEPNTANLVDFHMNPSVFEIIKQTQLFYKKTGFSPPWCGYLLEIKGNYVATGGFKGSPRNKSVEIAYMTIEEFRQKGIGSQLCKLLVEIAQKEDPDLHIRARTLPQKNYSTRILEKNGFIHVGMALDPEDGEVWEWEFKRG